MNQISRIIFTMLLVMILYFTLIWIVNSRIPQISIETIEPEEDTSLKMWLERFEQIYLDLCAAGEKIVANPFDDHKDIGIPSNEMLPAIASALNKKGFKAWINKSYSDSKIPHHLTIEWE